MSASDEFEPRTGDQRPRLRIDLPPVETGESRSRLRLDAENVAQPDAHHAVPDSWREMRAGLGRDITVGIVGFPNSGKTSYLYALKSLPRQVGRRRSQWLIGGGSAGFSGLTGGSGAPQIATRSGHLSFARFCRVKRAWTLIPGLGRTLGPARWLTTAEVSGETLQRIAEGTQHADASGTAEEYLTFLAHSSVIVGLVGVDGARAVRGVDRLPDPDRPLMEGLKSIERILEAAASRRSTDRQTRYPMVVSVLITKIDLVFGVPELDTVDLPAERSSLHSEVTQRDDKQLLSWLEASGTDSERVRFSLRRALSNSALAGDLNLQEAVAADFLKCHAPKSAIQLAAMQSDAVLGASIRCYLCAPYGAAFPDARGGDRFPSPDQLRPIMVHEPLEDALERSWQQQSVDRSRRRAIMLAAAIALVLMVFPGLRWILGASLDRVLASPTEIRQWEEVSDRLERLERCPELMLHLHVPAARWISPRVSQQHAARLLRCAELAPPQYAEERRQLLLQARELQPSDPAVANHLRDAGLKQVEWYLDAQLPRDDVIRSELDQQGVDMLVQALRRRAREYRDGVGDRRHDLLYRLEFARGIVSESRGVRGSWISVGPDATESVRAQFDECIQSVKRTDQSIGGSPKRLADPIDAAIESGQLEDVREQCGRRTTDLLSTWIREPKEWRDIESFAEAPGWLRQTRTARLTEAMRNFLQDRLRLIEVWNNRPPVEQAESTRECVGWLRDLRATRSVPLDGVRIDGLDDSAWNRLEEAIGRQEVLDELEVRQPWPAEWIVAACSRFPRTEKAQGRFGSLLAAQRVKLKQQLDELSGDPRITAAQRRVLDDALRLFGWRGEVELQAGSAGARAVDAASASPPNIPLLQSACAEFARLQTGPERRRDLLSRVLRALSASCCTTAARDIGALSAALEPLASPDGDVAAALLVSAQECLLMQRTLQADAVMAQADRLSALLPRVKADVLIGLRPTLEAIAREIQMSRSGEDLSSGSRFDRLLSCLEQVRVQDPRLKQLASKCRDHAGRVRRWNMRKVDTDANQETQPFWLCAYEWSRDAEVRSVLSEASDAARSKLQKDIRPVRVTVRPGGFGLEIGDERNPADQSALVLLESNVGLESVGAAKSLAELAGLRLPTKRELDLAASRGGTWDERRRPDLYERKSMYLSPASLEAIDVTADGIVGLNTGALEWTSSGLWGYTHLMPTQGVEQRRRIEPYTRGLRPALDLMPAELDAALGRP